MSSLLTAIGVVLVIVLILLVYIILKLSSSASNSSGSNTSSSLGGKNDNGSSKALNSKITITGLSLPPKIMSIDPKELHTACKTVFDSYKALDYKEAHIDRLSVSEWHTWQVSLLLAFLKIEREFHIGNPREFFPEQILSLTKKELDLEIDRILKKYDNNVDALQDRDSLSKHNIWNAREVGILFYYMAMHKIM